MCLSVCVTIISRDWQSDLVFYWATFSMPGPKRMLLLWLVLSFYSKQRNFTISLKCSGTSVQFPADWFLLPVFICEKLYSLWRVVHWVPDTNVHGDTTVGSSFPGWWGARHAIAFNGTNLSHGFLLPHVPAAMKWGKNEDEDSCDLGNYVTKGDPSHQIIVSFWYSFSEMMVKQVKK